MSKRSLEERFRAGRRAEDRGAQRLGARPTPASGTLTGAKGDYLRGTLLVESKATTADSMRLQAGWLNKIRAEAREKGLEPALAIQFVTGDGRPRGPGAWVCVPEEYLIELLDGQGG